MIHNFFHYGGMALMMYAFTSIVLLPSVFTILVTIITATMGLIMFLISLLIGDIFDEHREWW
jgi:hypothetical protein